MDLNKISTEIREILEKRRKELELTFIEDDHVYYMKDDNGLIKNDFPSVSKVIKYFYKEFDSEFHSLRMTNGDRKKQGELLNEWKNAGEISTNMGSRVHYNLEKNLIDLYGGYKEVREPIFNCEEPEIIKGDAMIKAGNDFIKLMHERGAVLLDTESILGDNELGYTGQPDKSWLIMNKENNGFGIVITDWKSNQPKNFKVMPYTEKMYKPFDTLHNNSLGHYQVQLPLYGKLMLKMLKGTKYEDIKLLGCIIVLLKKDGTFEEYKVPSSINNLVLRMDIKKYLK